MMWHFSGDQKVGRNTGKNRGSRSGTDCNRCHWRIWNKEIIRKSKNQFCKKEVVCLVSLQNWNQYPVIDFVPMQAWRGAGPNASWFAQQLLLKKWQNPKINKIMLKLFSSTCLARLSHQLNSPSSTGSSNRDFLQFVNPDVLEESRTFREQVHDRGQLLLATG